MRTKSGTISTGKVNTVMRSQSVSVKGATPKKSLAMFTMKTCPNCQAQLDDNAAFCTACGARFEQPAPAAQPEPKARIEVG